MEDKQQVPCRPGPQLIGCAVRNEDGEQLGIISQLVLQRETGLVAYVVVIATVDGTEKAFAVPYGALELEAGGAVLPLNADVFQYAPGMPLGDERHGA